MIIYVHMYLCKKSGGAKPLVIYDHIYLCQKGGHPPPLPLAPRFRRLCNEMSFKLKQLQTRNVGASTKVMGRKDFWNCKNLAI
jgi:hypothetical protein